MITILGYILLSIIVIVIVFFLYIEYAKWAKEYDWKHHNDDLKRELEEEIKKIEKEDGSIYHNFK